MNKFVKKNIRLSMEFDSYIWRHPRVLEKIPNKSVVYFTVVGDDDFNVWSGIAAGKVADRKDKFVQVRKEKNRWKIFKSEKLVHA
jgi:hypothetical protein